MDVETFLVKGISNMRKNTLQSLLGNIDLCNHGYSCQDCCWPWKGQIDHKGYGKVSYNGKKHILHGLIYDLVHDITPEPYDNHLHTCDTPLCANWSHVYLGSHQKNMDDKVERNRQVKGVHQVQAILNDSKVYQIRRHYYCGWKQYELAYFFDIALSTVNRITNKEDWKHLKGEALYR